MAKEPKPTGGIPSGPDATAKSGPGETVAEVKSTPAPGAEADPRDQRIADLELKLEAQAAILERLDAMLVSNAVNAGDALQEVKSKQEQEALKAEIDKGNVRRTQEACDREFSGRHRYRCSLPDGNGHPEITVSADNEVDARGRYLSVCGIRSAEKEVLVVRA